MDSLIKKLILLKTNPKLVETLPQGEVIEMMDTLLKAFRALQRAIEENKIKGDDGRTPVAGRDYPTHNEIYGAFNDALNRYGARFDRLETQVEKKLARIRDGKDAMVTASQIEEAARLASQLIKLPDFTKLVEKANDPYNDAIVMLQEAFERLEKRIDEIKITAPKQDHVIKRLKYMADVDTGTTPPNTNATLQYQPPTGKWTTGISITVSDTAPSDPKYGDLWVDTSGGGGDPSPS